LALQPFPSCIAGGEEANGDGTCGEAQEIAPSDLSAVHQLAIFESTPMRPQDAIVPQGCLIDPNS
jgi:hypothetical protein